MLHLAAPAITVRHFSEPSALGRLAAQLQPPLRRAFLTAVDKLGLRGDGFTAFESAFLEKLLPLLAKGLESGAAATLEALKAPLTFDLKNPRAAAWIESHGAELVKQISDDTRAGLQAILSRGYSDGLTSADMGRLIRPVIGLTERQSLAVDNYRRGLVERGLSDAQVESRTARYGEKQLRYRADLIARTESQFATNRGQREAWQQSAEAGFIDARSTRRVWIASSDACPECEALDGVEVAFDDEFDDGDPPVHAGCRCTTGLVFD